MSLSSKIVASLGLISALYLTGCSASNCDVEVFLDPELKKAYGQVPTLEVDIAGVNAEQAQRLQKMDLDLYFTPNSPQRKAIAPLTMYLSEDNPGPVIIEDGDDAWDLWEERGAQFIAVICNLPQFMSLIDEEEEGSEQNPSANSGALAGSMSEMANENSAVFNNGRVLLINMRDGMVRDSGEHLVQISVDGLFTLQDRPQDYLKKEEPQDSNIKTVQDLKKLEAEAQNQQLSAQAEQSAQAAQATEDTSAIGAGADAVSDAAEAADAANQAAQTLGAPPADSSVNFAPAKVSFPEMVQ